MKRITIYFYSKNNETIKSLAPPTKSEAAEGVWQAYFYLPEGMAANTLLLKIRNKPPMSKTRVQYM
jgi:hypothetical protein